MIYILTGDIRSGKTTALQDWAKTREDVDGLLCPDDENGKRYFLKVKLQEAFELEVEVESQQTISIGPFYFLKSAFKTANDFLLPFTSETKNQYLIIDELGKLELKNLGLHSAAKRLIPEYLNADKQHLILVVRDYLLDDIIEHYSISEYHILSKEDIANLN